MRSVGLVKGLRCDEQAIVKPVSERSGLDIFHVQSLMGVVWVRGRFKDSCPSMLVARKWVVARRTVVAWEAVLSGRTAMRVLVDAVCVVWASLVVGNDWLRSRSWSTDSSRVRPIEDDGLCCGAAWLFRCGYFISLRGNALRLGWWLWCRDCCVCSREECRWLWRLVGSQEEQLLWRALRSYRNWGWARVTVYIQVEFTWTGRGGGGSRQWVHPRIFSCVHRLWLWGKLSQREEGWCLHFANWLGYWRWQHQRGEGWGQNVFNLQHDELYAVESTFRGIG